MREEIEQLKNIGSQNIYAQTHIALHHIDNLIDGKYDDFSRVQFIGFISILEKEYNITLVAIRADGLAYFDGVEAQDDVDHGVFVTAKKKKKLAFLYLLIAAVIVIVVGFFSLQEDKTSIIKPVSNTTIEKVQKILPVAVNINNDTNISEVNVTQPSVEMQEKVVAVEKVTAVEKSVVHSLVIHPRERVWFGYIDVVSGKKHQTTTRKEITLDPSKEWLFAFGHGNVNINIDGKEKHFSSVKSIRFHYKDANLTQLNVNEFKKLNKGHIW